jgi:hypothetical protein
MAEFKIPFGRAKDETLEETDGANITWVIGALEKKLIEEPGSRAQKNREWIAAGKAELAKRAGGGGQLARTQAAAPIERVAPPLLGASMNDPKAVTKHLTELALSHHIVSPATTVDALPPGCGVAVNYVLVDPSTEKGGPREVYKVGDDLGLSGTTLAKIGAAAGVDWDASQSGRLDNGSDPHYCHFRAVGHVRNLDGSVRTLTGEVEIDARQGSPQIDEIKQKAARRDQPNDGGASQILELRKFLLRHAESKAKNRAIASMGLKRSYTKAELAKPFAVCRLMWTGQTDDPELKRVFAEKTADAMIGGMASLYGRPAPQPAPAAHALPAPPAPQRFDGSAPAFQGHAPPPVLTTTAAASDDPNDLGDYDDEGEPKSEPKPAATTRAQPKQQATVGDGVDPRY